MAYHNTIWKGLLVGLSLVVCWFTFQAIYITYNYYSLNKSTLTEFIEPTVKQTATEVFMIEADYVFKVDGVVYHGRSKVSAERFRNEWAANDALMKEPINKATVWYSSKNPQVSSLQKTFPVKECVSTLLLWGLFIYFFFLGKYVERTLQQDQQKK